MGVYIIGMEMPTNCDECRIMMFEDTNCAPELFCGCPIVFKAHPQGVDHRPDYCPLIFVPPHGRLIDADAFCRNIAYAKADDFIKAGVLAFAKDAPTIIEAEEGE